jgi:Spy/CpxP family protein refolding chaperone
MLDEIDASDDQIAAIEAILDGTHIQLEALHDGFDDHHDQVKAVLVAETVDREALEELRLEAVGVFDQASQLIAGAVGDVGEVLNPEQRAELAELAEELHGE